MNSDTRPRNSDRLQRSARSDRESAALQPGDLLSERRGSWQIPGPTEAAARKRQNRRPEH